VACCELVSLNVVLFFTQILNDSDFLKWRKLSHSCGWFENDLILEDSFENDLILEDSFEIMFWSSS